MHLAVIGETEGRLAADIVRRRLKAPCQAKIDAHAVAVVVALAFLNYVKVSGRKNGQLIAQCGFSALFGGELILLPMHSRCSLGWGPLCESFSALLVR